MSTTDTDQPGTAADQAPTTQRDGPKSAEQAAERQLAQYEAGVLDRFGSLKPGHEARRVPEYGLGTYVVNIETGQVCEWNGKWFLGGKVLLCQDCWEEGT